jgi:hypothetical protein
MNSMQCKPLLRTLPLALALGLLLPHAAAAQARADSLRRTPAASSV